MSRKNGKKVGRFETEGTRRWRSEVRRRGMTQHEVSLALDLLQPYVHRLLWGDAEMPLDVAFRVERNFGIAPQAFVPKRTKKSAA